MPSQRNTIFTPAITARGPSGYDPKFGAYLSDQAGLFASRGRYYTDTLNGLGLYSPLGQLPTITLPVYVKLGLMGGLAWLGYRRKLPLWAVLAGEAATFLLIESPVAPQTVAGIPVEVPSQ